jgi:uncharacterized Zn finger protein (UPF0148 family)
MIAIECPVCRTSFVSEPVEVHGTISCPSCGALMRREAMPHPAILKARIEDLGDLAE